MEISSSSDNSIHVLVLSVDDFFAQNQISAFGVINFIPDSIVLAASVTNPISENPIPAPGTLEYLKSKVPEKYHGFLNVFVDKEASTLPPHQDQDIKLSWKMAKLHHLAQFIPSHLRKRKHFVLTSWRILLKGLSALLPHLLPPLSCLSRNLMAPYVFVLITVV